MLTPTLTVVPTASLTSTISPVTTNTNIPEPSPTEEAIREFPILDVDHYQDCKITVEEFDEFAQWEKRNIQDMVLPAPDPEKFGFLNADMDEFKYTILEGNQSAFETPFNVGFSYCSTEGVYFKDGIEYPYNFILTPIVFSVPNEPREKVVIVAMTRAYDFPSETEYLQWVKDNWVGNKASRLKPINGHGEIALSPIADVMDHEFPDMDQRISEFQKNLDPRIIDGMILRQVF